MNRCCIYKSIHTIFFSWSVFTMDFMDASSVSQAELPRFQEIKEAYSKELEASVIFPDLVMRTAGSRGTVDVTPIHFTWKKKISFHKSYTPVFLT